MHHKEFLLPNMNHNTLILQDLLNDLETYAQFLILS